LTAGAPPQRSAGRRLTRAVRHGARRTRRALEPIGMVELRDARAFARRHGTSVRSFGAAREARLDLLPGWVDLRAGVVADVGANVGDWSAAVLRVVPEARVVAIEPAPEPRRRLSERFAGVPGISIDGRAVSDRPGTAVLHVTGHSHNSSLHAPHGGMGSLYETATGWEVVDRVQTPTTTLDELLAGEDVALLKIDVQGAEREVLRGADQVLGRTAAILIEVTFVSHYDGDATFPALHEQLSGSGFSLNALSDPFRASRGTGSILWADACYCRPAAATR
jgi:FkbM family methyltransferase